MAIRRFWTDSLGISLVIISFFVVIAVSVAQWSNPNSRYPGSVRNDGDDGTQTLFSWLSQLGYQVRPSRSSQSIPTGEDWVWLVIAPETSFTDIELASIQNWVNSGGTLIIAQESSTADELLKRFGVGMRVQWPSVEKEALQLPTLNWPWVGEVSIEASRRLRIDCDLTAVHLGDCTSPLVVSRGSGRGQLFVISSIYPFTNVGLQDGANAQFVRNLLRAGAAPGATVVFDEAHRDDRSSWLWESREGWGTMVALFVAVAYFIARQRKLGKSRPTTQQIDPERRKTAEFIRSIASVDKSDRHTAVRQHYWYRLKRRLGSRYGVDSGLNDQLFLAEMTTYLDDEEMGRLISIAMSYQEPQVTPFHLQNWTEQVIQLSDSMGSRQ